MAQALGPGKGHSFQGLWDTRLQAGEWDALGVSPAHTGVLILSLEAENCVLSAVVAALIPGERERAREKGLWMPFALSCVTIVPCFLGYRWPRKGHWASAGF